MVLGARGSMGNVAVTLDQRIKMKVEIRLLNDDEVLATIKNPEDILHEFLIIGGTMPKEDKMVDLDTSGPGAEINLEEQKDESVVNTEAPKQGLEKEPVETKQEEVKED